PANWRGVIKLKNELAVGGLAFFLLFEAVFTIRGKLGDLPLLAFVFAEVLDDERLHAGDAKQSLAGGVDGEAPEVAGNPAAVEFFGDGSGGARAAEAVKDKVSLIGRSFDDSIKQGLRLLGRVIKTL